MRSPPVPRCLGPRWSGVRRAVGAAPIEYLTRWRLLKAHRLVKYSAQPIERVASEVGFSSAQTLTRAFKRQFGYPPNRLRLPGRKEDGAIL